MILGREKEPKVDQPADVESTYTREWGARGSVSGNPLTKLDEFAQQRAGCHRSRCKDSASESSRGRL